MLSYNSSLSESDMKVFMTAILLALDAFFKRRQVSIALGRHKDIISIRNSCVRALRQHPGPLHVCRLKLPA